MLSITTLDKINRYIISTGLNDTEFCQNVGLNKAALYDWRTGKTKSYNKHLPKIAEVLGVTVDELMEDDNTSPIYSSQRTVNIIKEVIEARGLHVGDVLTGLKLSPNALKNMTATKSLSTEALEALAEKLAVNMQVLRGYEPFDADKDYKLETQLLKLISSEKEEAKKILEYYFRLNEENRDYIKGEMIRMYKREQE